MIRIPYFVIPAFITAFCGCATIINGSTQDVQVLMPEGTHVINLTPENEFNIFTAANGKTFLHLVREKKYQLQFSYKGQEAAASVASSFEPAWLLADITTDFIGYFVDGVTGDWLSFDEPLIVHFIGDTDKRYAGLPFVETYENNFNTKKGVFVLNVRGSTVFPMAENGGFSYGVSAGYKLTPNLFLGLEYENGSGVDIVPSTSIYFTGTSYSQYNAVCRYYEHSLYVSAGGGISSVSTDSLGLDRFIYHDSTGILSDHIQYLSPSSKIMPSVFLAVGYSGKTVFFELRHTLGLASIPLASGESGKFELTTFTAGINLHF